MQSKPGSSAAQAFSADAATTTIVRTRSHLDAVRFARAAVGDPRGAGMLIGPAGSGKSVIARDYAESLPQGVATATVNAARIRPEQLLKAIVEEFGYRTDLESADELLRLLDVFAVQQARSVEPPVVIIEDVDRSLPATLRAINLIATLTVQGRPALRFLLTSRKRLPALFEKPSMEAIGKRIAATFELKPMTARETIAYLHQKLEKAGIPVPDDIFPVDACERLHQRADGWPGLLDEFASEVLAPPQPEAAQAGDSVKAKQRPVRSRDKAPPRLIVSRDGRVVEQFEFAERKVLLGRSEFADIQVQDSFASKLHALLLLYSDALVLLDLNSANGTTVNSVKVQSTLLVSDDVISIGHHRIKIENAPRPNAERLRQLTTSDTSRMKSLADMRRKRLRIVPSNKSGRRS